MKWVKDSSLLECNVKKHFLYKQFLWSSLTHFFPISPFDPPENIRKLLVFWWYFQGEGQKGTLGRNRSTLYWLHYHNSSIKAENVHKFQRKTSPYHKEMAPSKVSLWILRNSRDCDCSWSHQVWRPPTLLKRLQHRCFPDHLFYRTPPDNVSFIIEEKKPV